LVNFIFGSILLALDLLQGVENFVHVLQSLLQFSPDLIHLLDCPANAAGGQVRTLPGLAWWARLLWTIGPITTITAVIAIESPASATTSPSAVRAAVVVWPRSSRTFDWPLARWPFLCRSFCRRPFLFFAFWFRIHCVSPANFYFSSGKINAINVTNQKTGGVKNSKKTASQPVPTDIKRYQAVRAFARWPKEDSPVVKLT
jgi:hypothetical protein